MVKYHEIPMTAGVLSTLKADRGFGVGENATLSRGRQIYIFQFLKNSMKLRNLWSGRGGGGGGGDAGSRLLDSTLCAWQEVDMAAFNFRRYRT